MSGGVSYQLGSDQTMAPVDPNMGFVTKDRDGWIRLGRTLLRIGAFDIFYRPAGVNIFLSGLGRRYALETARSSSHRAPGR